jgi:hypothetical protein
MRYRFVAAERATFPVRMLCRIVGVAVSGFYAWPRRWPGRREEDRRVSERIGAIFAASRGTYGSPRVHAGAKRRFAPRGGRPGRPQAGRTAHARRRPRRRAPATSRPAHDRQPARPSGRPGPARAGVHGRPAGHGLAGRPQLHPDRGRLAVPRRHQGHGHARDRRLEHGRSPRGRAGVRRPADGPAAAAAAAGAHPSIIPTVACSTRAGPIG